MQINVPTFSRLKVCGPCGTVVGTFRDFRRSRHLVQHGRCPRHLGPADDVRWEGFDFNERVALCHCCAATPLESGSKWSVWFCDPCKREVGLLNGRHGRCVIPIGCHSLHAGWILTDDQLDDTVGVHIFVENVNSAGAAIDILSAWAKKAVALNLVAVGADPASVVPLPEYRARTAGTVDTALRFREMCAYLDEKGRKLVAAG